jgi:hypothetical protein
MHGLGQQGYAWPQNALNFSGICVNAYPHTQMHDSVNPLDGAFLPQMSCPKPMKCPTPPFHSIARSKNLFVGHNVLRKRNIGEQDSPFFGIFPDDELSLYVDIRETVKTQVGGETCDEVKAKLPFRGQGWQLGKSIWAERLKHSESQDYWDSDKVHLKGFRKDWELTKKLPRMAKLLRKIDKGVRDEGEVPSSSFVVHDAAALNSALVVPTIPLLCCG